MKLCDKLYENDSFAKSLLRSSVAMKYVDKSAGNTVKNYFKM